MVRVWLAREDAWSLCKRTLKEVCGKTPEIARTALGKPYAVSGEVFFSVSHAKELVACCVSTDREVGVDVEPLSNGPRVLRMAEDVLTPDEIAHLGDAREERAVVLWSCKEAYVKAYGARLGEIDPEKIGFRVSGARARLVSGGVGPAVLRVLVHRGHAIVVAARGRRAFDLRVTDERDEKHDEEARVTLMKHGERGRNVSRDEKGAEPELREGARGERDRKRAVPSKASSRDRKREHDDRERRGAVRKVNRPRVR